MSTVTITLSDNACGQIDTRVDFADDVPGIPSRAEIFGLALLEVIDQGQRCSCGLPDSGPCPHCVPEKVR